MQSSVVGLDNSEASERALRFAIGVVPTEDPLILVHVIPWSPYSFSTQTDNENRPRRKSEEIEAAQQQVLDPMLAIAVENGHQARGLVRHGHPSEMLNEIAGEENSRHIFIGRTGNSRLKAALFGSTASRLVQIADVPVTVVP